MSCSLTARRRVSSQAGSLAIAPMAFSEIRDHHLTPPKEEQLRRIQKYIQALPMLHIVGYCNACIGRRRMGGADVVHLTEPAVQGL